MKLARDIPELDEAKAQRVAQMSLREATTTLAASSHSEEEFDERFQVEYGRYPADLRR